MRKRILYSLFFGGFFVGTLYAQNAETYNAQGITLYDQGKYAEALKQFEKAFQLEPQEPNYSHNISSSLTKLKKPKEAITFADKAIQLAPKEARFYVARANAYAGFGKPEEAIADYSEAIKLKPDYAEAYRYRAVERVKIKADQEAIADFDKALQLNPGIRSVRFFNQRALAYYYLKQYEKALENFKTASELNPKEGVYFYNQGQTLLYLDRKEEAEEAFAKAKNLGFEGKPEYPNDNQTQTESSVVEVPSQFHYVVDQAHIFSLDHKANLEKKLKAYEDSTSTQIAILTIETLGGKGLASYAVEVANQWGIGQKDKNNGLLILIAKQERGIHIATGYGLEATIPDLAAKKIIDNFITPNFKERKFYKGIDVALDKIFGLLSGEFEAFDLEPFWDAWRIAWCIFLFLFLMAKWEEFYRHKWKHKSLFVYVGFIAWIVGIELLNMHVLKGNVWHFTLTVGGLSLIAYLYNVYAKKYRQVDMYRQYCEDRLYISNKWEKFKDKYMPQEVENKKNALDLELKSVTQDSKGLYQLYKKIREIFEHPEKHFNERPDQKLVEGIEVFRKVLGDMDNKEHKDYFKKTFKEITDYFDTKVRENTTLSPEDKEKLQYWENFFSKENSKKYKTHYREIKTKLNEKDFWENTKVLYVSPEKIDKELYKLKSEFEDLENVKTLESLTALYHKVSELYESPEKFAQKRLDADLIALNNNSSFQAVLEHKAYLEKDRKEAKARLDKELTRFDKQSSLKDFETVEELRYYEKTLEYFENLKTNPSEVLSFDKDYLENYAKKYFEEEGWKSYYKTYTISSINQKIERLKDSHQQAKSGQERYEVYSSIENFKASPSIYLEKPKPSYSSSSSSSYSSSSRSSSSSSSSWSSSSSSSSSWSSSSSSSSSSWGGGSFGGGGASGGW